MQMCCWKSPTGSMHRMSKHLSLTFHRDPAHGWLEVDRNHIADLAICHWVSRASYVGDDKAYLEQDCDMPLFLEAAERFGWTVTFNESHSNTLSNIRNLPRYEPPPYPCTPTQQLSRRRF